MNFSYRGAGYLSQPLTLLERDSLIKEAVTAIEKKNIQFDAIVARGLSGVVFGSMLAVVMEKHLVIVRKGESTHSDSLIEGIEGAFNYIIVDDLVASGDTIKKIKAEMSVSRWEATCKGLYLYNDNWISSCVRRDFESMGIEQINPRITNDILGRK